MIQTSVNKLGPLTTMVANAGIAQVKPLLEVTELDMQRMFSINVFGVHNCFSLAAKQMIAQGAPPSLGSSPTGAANPSVYKLISASSVAAFKPFSLLSHYVSSKWAVRGLTQCNDAHGKSLLNELTIFPAYAMELAEHKITANAYCPGIVGTGIAIHADTVFRDMLISQ
jgi:NAD(P)-dependent dehydrogenase (short-subunit alcohol dehydrogenase family)